MKNIEEYLKVVLLNHPNANFEVKKGDLIPQLICEKIHYPELQEVEELTDSTDTAHGEDEFD